MGELTETLISPPPPQVILLPPTSSSSAKTTTNHNHPRPMPVREDCWSEDATFTLIEAWGQHYLDLNRGNLRQKHWQEVADAVNASHGHSEQGKKGPRFRTDVQCKNRIDTLKKKYKVEKSRVLDSRGSYTSPWSFFTPLDSLLAGSPSAVKKSSPPIPYPPFPSSSPLVGDMQVMGVGPPMAVPLLPYRKMSGTTLPTASPAVPQKKTSPVMPSPQGVVDYSNFRRNYSAFAAAAAAETDEEEEEEDEEDEVEEEVVKGEDLLGGMGEQVKKETRVMGEAEGIRNLARAIERFGEVYARVESEKQRQIVELEKQRMQFAKELECQRMQMLVELQVQLEKVKRAKRSNSNETYR